MTSYYYKAKKVRDPSLHIADSQSNNYGTSLTALNEAWSSVTATKKELRNIDSRIRQSATSPIHNTNFSENDARLSPPARKHSNIERRVVYELPQNSKYRKENIPPQSNPQPTLRYQNYIGEEYLRGTELATYENFDYYNHNNESYAKNTSQDGTRVNTSLTGRSLLAKEKKSEALKRLKERINRQKINSSSSFAEENDFPGKPYHEEHDKIKVSNDNIISQNMVRKVATAPSAPTYKGFNQPDATYVKVSPHTKRKQRQVSSKILQKPPSAKESVRSKGGKSGKKQRIIAPKKPANIIGTSSWRVGLEIQKKVKKEMKGKLPSRIQGGKKPKQKEISPEVSKSQNTSTHQPQAQDSEHSVVQIKNNSFSENERELLPRKDSTDGVTDNDLHSLCEHKSHKSKEEITSEDNKDKDNTDDENDISDLRDNDKLPKTAKDVLEEMQNDVVFTPEKGASTKKKNIKAVVDTGLRNYKSVHDKRSPPVKRKLVNGWAKATTNLPDTLFEQVKSYLEFENAGKTYKDDELYPSRKIRHYDQSEVQKYMMKQQAERKKQRLNEKEKQKKQKEQQDIKLQELFEKQKAAVKENSLLRRKHTLASTFTKQYKTETQPFTGQFQNINYSYDEHSRMYPIEQPEVTQLGIANVVISGKYLGQKDFSTNTTSTSTSVPEQTSDTDSNDSDTFEEETELLKSAKTKSVDDPYNSVKVDRVAAIRATAAALRERLNMESKRLTNLVHSKRQPTIESSFYQNQNEETEEESHMPGQYPGVHNIDSQAALNTRLREMEKAAQKIQALYRGHSVRQSLQSWQLPSGLTLHQTLEEARRRAFLADLDNEEPVKLASNNYAPIKMPAAREMKVHKKLPSSSSDISKDSMTGMISEALVNSKSLLEDANKSLSRMSSRKSRSKDDRNDTFPTYSYSEKEKGRKQHSPMPTSDKSEDPNERLRKILQKYKDVPADKYSVINIFTRNYPSLRQQQLADHTTGLSQTGTETEKIIADAYADNNHENTSMDEYLSEQSLDDADASKDSTLTSSHQHSAVASKESLNQYNHSPPSKSPLNKSSYRSLLSPKSRRGMSSGSDTSERLFSPRSPSPEIIIKSNKTPVSKPDRSITDDVLTISQLSPSLFSDDDNDNGELNPVLTSTKRSPNKEVEKEKQTYNGTPLTHNINYNRGDERMSPNALERRLRAEINLFDSVGDSLQQINEMDRIRDIVQAQQETVSLAQVLKNHQLTHQQQIDRMSMEAREKAAKSAQNIEIVKRNAAEAAANAMKAMAEIKTKAANDVVDSTKQLSHIQNEATLLSLNAIKEAEQARKGAFESYKQSVEERLSNVGSVVTAAASAASATAVQAALDQHRNRLENLRKDSLHKVSKTYTSSFTEETTSETSRSSPSTTTRDSTSKTITGDSAATEKSHIASVISEDVPVRTSKQGDSSASAMSSVKEVISSVDLTPRTVSDFRGDATDGVSEDLPKTEDRELTEALFSSGKKSYSAPDDSIHSNYSEEKFHSSFTEDELKHDFRQLLPSENHCRKSLDHRDYIMSGNDTSSDELATPRNAAQWPKKHSKSPFVDENTFTRFTTDMVRQYVQEEEVRAKHQAALLGLREKAIIEKTKAEVAYLEMQKKSLKNKGVSDEKMPKKQRAIMMKLEAEQAEIRRLKEAHKAASNERIYMLKQEQEIRRIQHSTQKIWNEVGNYKDDKQKAKHNIEKEESSPTKEVSSIQEDEKISDASLSTAVDDSIVSKDNEISEHISEEENITTHLLSVGTETSSSIRSSAKSDKKSKASMTQDGSVVDEIYKEEKTDLSSSVSQDLKKLKYMASKKYLTEREKKLQTRKQQFSEIMERKTKLKTWRHKIMEEEMRLKADIRKVLDHGVTKADETSGRDSFEDSTITEHTSRKHKKQSTSASKRSEVDIVASQSEASIAADASSIAEDFASEKETLDNTITEAINIQSQASPKSSVHSEISEATSYRSISKREASSNKTVVTDRSRVAAVDTSSYRYSNDTFEEATTKSQATPSVSATATSRKHRKKSEEDSLTEGTSDASDTEQRLKALENELRRRRTELQKLRKKKEKENLRRKEQELKKELQAVEQQINRETKENWTTSEHSQNNIPSKVSTPRVLSPRNSIDTIILPEKVKFPGDKDSRKILDFSDKESDTDKSVSSKISKKSEISTPKQLSSKKDSLSKLHVISNNNKSEKDVSEHSSPIIQLDKQDSVDEISEISIGKDRSDLSNQISENLTTARSSSHKSSVIEELSAKSSSQKSNRSVGNIYDDDFFESDTSKHDKSSSVYEDISRHSLLSSKGDAYSRKSESTAIDTSRKDASLKLSEATKISLSKDVEDSQMPSAKYSSRFESDSESKSDVSDKSEVLNKSDKSISEERLSIAEDISGSVSVSIDEVSYKDDGGKTTREPSCSKDLSETKVKEYESDASRTSSAASVRNAISDKIVLDESDKSISENDKSRSLSSKKLSSKSSRTSKVSSSSTASEVIQPDDFSKSNVSSVLGFRVNERVRVEDSMSGTIRYLGKTPFSPVLVAGVELDTPMGTNNGTFQGKQYFNCPIDHGFFTTIERLKLFNEDAGARRASEASASLSSSTVNEVDESLEQLSVKEEENSYSEDFEQTSTHTKETLNKHDMMTPEPELSSSSSTLSDKMEEIIKSVGEASIHSILNEDNSLEIGDLNSQSSSDIESLSGGEIASPAKLDLQPLADSITDSIMRSIIADSIGIVTPRKDDNDSDVDFKVVNREQTFKSSPPSEMDESYVTPKASITEPVPEVSVEPVSKQLPEPVDVATRQLLNEALSVIINVKKGKEDKLLEKEKRKSVNNNNRNSQDFLSLLTNDEAIQSPPNHREKSVEELNSNLLTEKLNQLKDVHQQLGLLLGDDDDDDDEDDDDDDENDIQVNVDNFIIQHPKPTVVKEEVIKVPLNEKDTRNIVSLALDEISKHSVDMDTLSRLKMPDDIIFMSIDDETLDADSTNLYKELIFEMTLHLFCEIKDFRELQSKPRAPWLKMPRKTFSKFTRKTQISEESLSDRIAQQVCTCIGLQLGRPSLTQFKRKLPLNLAKKDYVDAILVEELREEEAQWVNYDEDELRVKFQLADTILDSLLEETVYIISDALCQI